MSSPEQLPAVIEQTLIQQRQNGADMQRLVAQMAQIAAGLDRRLRMLEEQMSRKVTITHAQVRQLNAAMMARSRAVCGKYGLDEKACAGKLKSAIARDVKKQYAVDDLHDLPNSYFDLALESIRSWSSFAAVRKIRDKQIQGG